jgi:hypothetical protein
VSDQGSSRGQWLDWLKAEYLPSIANGPPGSWLVDADRLEALCDWIALSPLETSDVMHYLRTQEWPT